MAAESSRARLLRRRHQHERQAVVFGSLAAGIAVTVLAAAAVYTGTVDAPFLDRAFVTETPSVAPGQELSPIPCPPAGTLPVAYAAASVTVYNGSKRGGLAKTTADALTARGFTIAGTGNFPTVIPLPVEIRFGADGLASAYTLAAHLTKPRLVLDKRDGAGVDLVVGAEFGGLLAADKVALDPTVELVGVAGCVPLETALADALPAPTPSPSPTPSDATAPGTDAPPADPNADPGANG